MDDAGTATTAEKQHVTRTPGVCGGKPCIAGTRIRVWDVYNWHERDRWPATEIVNQFPQLTVAQVHAALAYFYDHEDEIREQAAADQAFVEEMRRQSGESCLMQLARERRNDAAVSR